MKLFPNIEKLWEAYKDAELILFNIPICLPDGNYIKRSCDQEAKEKLGKRQYSVFLFHAEKPSMLSTVLKQVTMEK